jgi:hypothetical protein
VRVRGVQECEWLIIPEPGPVRATPFVAVFGFPVSSGGGVLTAHVSAPPAAASGGAAQHLEHYGEPTTRPPAPQPRVVRNDVHGGDAGADGYAAARDAAVPSVHLVDGDDDGNDDAPLGVQMVAVDLLEHGGATTARNPLYNGATV